MLHSCDASLSLFCQCRINYKAVISDTCSFLLTRPYGHNPPTGSQRLGSGRLVSGRLGAGRLGTGTGNAESYHPSFYFSKA